MSVSNIVNGDKTATWKDISADTVNVNSFTTNGLSAGAISCSTVTASGAIAAGGNVTGVNVTASSSLIGADLTTTGDAAIGGNITLGTKFISALTDISPAPSIALSQAQGYIQLTPNVAFPTASTVDVTLTSADIYADSLIMLSSGPSAANPSLDYHLKSVSVGSAVVTVSNITGGSVSGTFAFSYLIL